MNILGGIKGFLRRFGRDERGSTVTMIAAAAVPLVAFMGISIDTARGYMLKQRLHYAIDGAALAAARSSLEADYADIGKKFFDANFPSGFMGVTNLQVSFNLSSDKRQVTVDISASMPTSLMQVVGVDDVDIGFQTIAQREAKGLELAIALDNTGSMSNSDINDLEDATKDLLDILYGDEETVDNLYVALLPFDLRVNLSNYKSIFDFTPYEDHPTRVCNNQRSGHETDDAPPSTSAFNSQYKESYIDNKWGCRAVPALALTKERSTLDAVLEEMDDRGGTRIDIAAAWAFRMVSPSWRGLWGDPDLPLDYDEPLMDKAVIIMTDGKNDPHPDGSSGVPTAATANARLTDTCTKMKAQGIIVYTIQFRISDSALKTLLQNCATDASHYYHADDDELDDVFIAIANQLSNLRLVN